jgi:drug/metabolite transporter (DMT)-like permease
LEARGPYLGLLLGTCAVFLWSFGASFTCIGAPVLGPWYFIAITTFIGASLQMVIRRLYYGHLKNTIALPVKLYLITLLGFAFNVLSYPLALATAQNDPQRCAVNLINYLWPVLTVLCAVLWVPDARFSLSVLLAIVCAAAGTVLANGREIIGLLSANGRSPGPAHVGHLVPYFLGFYGAMAWAVYSSLLSRWRQWARNYTTSPLGLFMAGAIALLAGVGLGGPLPRITPAAAAATLLCGLGTQCGGYMLWELAVLRANVKALGLIGGMTPILSTVWLCIFLRYVPGPELGIAAILVGIAVILGTRS